MSLILAATALAQQIDPAFAPVITKKGASPTNGYYRLCSP